MVAKKYQKNFIKKTLRFLNIWRYLPYTEVEDNFWPNFNK